MEKIRTTYNRQLSPEGLSFAATELLNAKSSSLISLKAQPCLTRKTNHVNAVDVDVTNLVCSWIQHEWLALLLQVHSAAGQGTRSGNSS